MNYVFIRTFVVNDIFQLSVILCKYEFAMKCNVYSGRVVSRLQTVIFVCQTEQLSMNRNNKIFQVKQFLNLTELMYFGILKRLI